MVKWLQNNYRTDLPIITVKTSKETLDQFDFAFFNFLTQFILSGYFIRYLNQIGYLNQIDPKFLLTFQSFFLMDRFVFYFEAISPWDHAIALYKT